jgi:HEAT repeat protein
MSGKEHETMKSLLLSGLLMSAAIAAGVNSASAEDLSTKSNSSTAVDSDILLMRAADSPLKERMNALHSAFQAKQALSKADQIGLARATAAISTNKQEDARFRTDAIWALSGTAMMLRKDGTWSDEDVSRECRFLLGTAADATENVQVRRMSIASLGDLQLKEGIPVVTAILTDKANENRPELARSSAIALAALAPDQALQPIANLLTVTTNATVFGSAAYAMGALRSADAISVLVSNRLRLDDNLSVDNAIESSIAVVLETLENENDPHILSAIAATSSLWRQDQKLQYTPLLIGLVTNRDAPIGVRREALVRLIEDADSLPLEARKERVTSLLPLVEAEDVFGEQTKRMHGVLAATTLPCINAGVSDQRTANDPQGGGHE